MTGFMTGPTPADNSWSIKRAISLSHLCSGWLNVWPWAVQLLTVSATCPTATPGLRFAADCQC